MPNTEPADSFDISMDFEGTMRFHAAALTAAPSGEVTPGTTYAADWQDGDMGRIRALEAACTLIDQIQQQSLLPARLWIEAHGVSSGIRMALEGIQDEDTLYLANWEDKPHRLMYDAAAIMTRAADAYAALPLAA